MRNVVTPRVKQSNCEREQFETPLRARGGHVAALEAKVFVLVAPIIIGSKN